MGVPPEKTLSAFIFERGLDLIVVLGLATLFVQSTRVLLTAVVFVSLIFGVLIICYRSPNLLESLSKAFERKAWPLLASWINVLSQGIKGSQCWFNLFHLSHGFLLGLLAWGLTASSFVVLVSSLSIPIPEIQAFSVYPLAMLGGAASMLPGGIGSTEAIVTSLLVAQGSDLQTGLLAAIGIRLTTLWLAMLLGFVALTVLETVFSNRVRVRDS
jgi:uncharacterized membrane protein YbhN (UPF0104 family)